MLIISILLFGAFALPFAGLTKQDYNHLTALSVLYCLLTTVQGVYTVIEASYIPVFMRSAGWFRSPRRIRLEVDGSAPDENEPEKRTWKKGFTVSVLGLVSSNVGGLVALIIGIILVYGRGSYVKTGYSNYLLAITIAGCITSMYSRVCCPEVHSELTKKLSCLRNYRPPSPSVHSWPNKTNSRRKCASPSGKGLVSNY